MKSHESRLGQRNKKENQVIKAPIKHRRSRLDHASTWTKRAHPTPREASKPSPKAAACHVWRRGPNVTHSRTREARPDSPPVTFEHDPNQPRQGQAHPGHILASPKRDSNVTSLQGPKLSPHSSEVTFGPSSRLGPNVTYFLKANDL
ncbi:hypothetical protein PIB30_054757 [Stylosanthes scabra]|uniref:Uncharacterized protein n=1 Tax=Stylosanthes scabra TaxID=79078 RepID=A0ABU6VHE4_9FABA|nr:hypothetical protein [Stylosanthes scabra]